MKEDVGVLIFRDFPLICIPKSKKYELLRVSKGIHFSAFRHEGVPGRLDTLSGYKLGANLPASSHTQLFFPLRDPSIAQTVSTVKMYYKFGVWKGGGNSKQQAKVPSENHHGNNRINPTAEGMRSS